MALLVGAVTWACYAASFDVFRSVGIPVLCSLVVLCVVFIFNLIRAPYLLDKEKIAEIDRLKAEGAAHQSIQDLRSRFAALMNEGAELADTLRKGLSDKDYSPWLIQRNDWFNRTASALENAGHPTEASAFKHATEYAPEFKGVANAAFWHKFYGEQLEHTRVELREIVKQKIP